MSQHLHGREFIQASVAAAGVITAWAGGRRPRRLRDDYRRAGARL
jgi:hypothetical protein